MTRNLVVFPGNDENMKFHLCRFSNFLVLFGSTTSNYHVVKKALGHLCVHQHFNEFLCSGMHFAHQIGMHNLTLLRDIFKQLTNKLGLNPFEQLKDVDSVFKDELLPGNKNSSEVVN